MKTSQNSLPITEMITKICIEWGFHEHVWKILASKVRNLEKSQQMKAKQEERQRIIGILKKMAERIGEDTDSQFCAGTLWTAIDRICDNQ